MPLGKYVRLRHLRPHELPSHPDLAEHQPHSVDVHTFIQDVLEEASTFMLDYVPRHFEEKSAAKSSPPSKATVRIAVKDVKASEIEELAVETGRASDDVVENWVSRLSIHENKKELGTADWSEFETALLVDHAKHEQKYTPDLYAAHQVISWDQTSLNNVKGWDKVQMGIYEMCHNMPTPLESRVFTALILGGRATRVAEANSSFITVQIPVESSGLPNTMHAAGRNKAGPQSTHGHKETISGKYVSVEKVDLIEQDTKIKWEMATASDAGGNIPMWMQKLGTPGAITKDVGLVFKWLHDERTSNS